MSPLGNSRPERILIVSPDTEKADFWKSALVREGFEVAVAKDLFSAKALLGSQRFDSLVFISFRWREIELDDLLPLQLKMRRGSFVVLGEESGELRCELLNVAADLCVGAECGEREFAASLRSLGRHGVKCILQPLIPGVLDLETADGRMTRVDCEPNISVRLVGQELLLCEALGVRPGAVVTKKDLKEFIWRKPVSDYTLYRLKCRTNRSVRDLRLVTIESAHSVGYRYEFSEDVW